MKENPNPEYVPHLNESLSSFPANENKKIEICRMGVVDLDNGCEPHFRVNSDDMIDLAVGEVGNADPDSDYDGKFAAKVTILIEFLCECKEKENEM